MSVFGKLYTLIGLISLSVIGSYTQASAYRSVNTYTNKDIRYIDVPKEFERKTIQHWNMVSYYIKYSPEQVIVLNWGGYGGSVEIAKDFIQDLQLAQKQFKIIIVNIINHSFSMHALAPCYANQIINSDNKLLMFHADSIKHNNTEEVLPRNKSYIIDEFNQCIKIGLLTHQQVYQVYIKHLELYVNNTLTIFEADLRVRS